MNLFKFFQPTVTLSTALMPTLVSACSVLSGALRYAWLMSLRGRGMYCKVKLLREERAEEEGDTRGRGEVIEGDSDGLKR